MVPIDYPALSCESDGTWRGDTCLALAGREERKKKNSKLLTTSRSLNRGPAGFDGGINFVDGVGRDEKIY